MQNLKLLAAHISIHAPSRERPIGFIGCYTYNDFNPRSLAGATGGAGGSGKGDYDFNPRSLAGATKLFYGIFAAGDISIHAPSRERLISGAKFKTLTGISIHAPSRERPSGGMLLCRLFQFQSTLPRGSDYDKSSSFYCLRDFNPRSLAGATLSPL